MIVNNQYTHLNDLTIVDAQIVKRSSNYFLVLTTQDAKHIFVNEFTSQSELANLSVNQIENLRYVHSKIFHSKFFEIREQSDLDALKNRLVSCDAREKEKDTFFFTQNLVVKEATKTSSKKKKN